MSFCCGRCGYTAEKKQHLKQHLQRKYACPSHLSNVSRESLLDTILPQAKKLICERGCKQTFSHRSSLSRHRKHCSGSAVASQSGHHNSLNLIQGNHNVLENKTYNVTINITPFSDISPKLDFLRFIELMKKGALSTILTLIEDHQYNPDKPEHMNMYISNLKDKIGRVFEEHGWKVCDATTLSDEVYNMYQKTVDDLVEEVEDDENKSSMRELLGELFGKLENSSRKWNRSVSRDEFVGHAKKEISLLLYNNRDKVRGAHKLRF